MEEGDPMDLPDFDIGWQELFEETDEEMGWQEDIDWGELDDLHVPCDAEFMLEDLISSEDDLMESDEEEMDQEGYGENFIIENYTERHIIKFKIRGYEYTIRLNDIDESVEYMEAVQVVHHTMQRKSLCPLCSLCN
jgi:hypothetical protein